MPKVYLAISLLVLFSTSVFASEEDDFPKVKKPKYKRPQNGKLFLPGESNLDSLPDDIRNALAGADIDLDEIDDIVRNKNGDTLADKLKRYRKYLDSKLKGQEEVKQAFLKLMKQRFVIGTHDISPAVFFLVGMPANGKDTAAIALTNMFNQSFNGHQEHLYYMPTAKTVAMAWKMFGSATGYMGSGDISPLIKWVVKHSGGKYKLVKGQTEKVELNPDFVSFDKPLQGYFSPHKAVVFADELHDWSASAKNDLLKKAIETGYFTINNPNGGVDHLKVPITFVLASNDAIELVSYRDANGNRRGKPLSFSELKKNWDGVHSDKIAIRAAISKKNDTRNDKGTSEEFLNRIPSNRLLLMEPLSPEVLAEIASEKLEALALKLRLSNGIYGQIRVHFEPSVSKLVSTYDYNPEEAARHLSSNILELVESHFYDHVAEFSVLKESRPFGMIYVGVDDDLNLTLKFTDHEETFKTVTVAINSPIKGKALLASSGLSELQNIYSELVENVFGIEDIAKRLTKSVIEREYLKQKKKDNTPAAVSMFLGLSSTGKTETAKVFSKKMGNYWNQTGELLLTIDFSNVQTIHQLREKILGTKNPFGQIEPSEFMQHYDKYQGHAVFVFDEASNAPKELLRGLYDIFREAEVNTFADGKPRSMSNVYIFMTGNVGEEWYQNIPKDIPPQELMNAYMQAYKAAYKNPAVRRKTLLTAFTDALINRVGDENIYFFSPLEYESIRKLAMHKLRQMFAKDLSGEGGWDIKFSDEDSLDQFLDFIELEMFSVAEQGASIEHAIKKELRPLVIEALLENNVPQGTKVEIKYSSVLELASDNSSSYQKGLQLSLRTRSNQSFNMVLKGQKRMKDMPENKQIMLATAYHEVGHEIVRQALLSDKFEPRRILILPGVGNIGGEMIRYAGLAESEMTEKASYTKAFILKRMAALMAGAVAEDMISGKHGAGISNDIKRASNLARSAVLFYGLESEEWGWQSFESKGASMAEILSRLDQNQRKTLTKIVDDYLHDAYHLAKAVITTHLDSHFIPMTLKLAEKGELKEQDIKEFYKNKMDLDKVIEWFENEENRPEEKNSDKLNLQHRMDIDEQFQMPEEKIVDLQKLYQKERLKKIESVGCHPSLFF